jgi:hypothetical protein
MERSLPKLVTYCGHRNTHASTRTVLKNAERYIILRLHKDDLVILIFNSHDPYTITVSAK